MATDPGMAWTNDAVVAIEAPPDADFDPLPEAQWSLDAPRTGVCGAVGPRVIALPGGGFRMYYSQILPRPGFPAGANDYVTYYAGYSQSNRVYILRTVSDDGLTWRKDAEPVIAPGPGGWDAAKCSELCVIRLPRRDGTPPRYRMLYEAWEGTAANERGAWRIASATSSF